MSSFIREEIIDKIKQLKAFAIEIKLEEQYINFEGLSGEELKQAKIKKAGLESDLAACKLQLQTFEKRLNSLSDKRRDLLRILSNTPLPITESNQRKFATKISEAFKNAKDSKHAVQRLRIKTKGLVITEDSALYNIQLAVATGREVYLSDYFNKGGAEEIYKHNQGRAFAVLLVDSEVDENSAKIGNHFIGLKIDKKSLLIFNPSGAKDYKIRWLLIQKIAKSLMLDGKGVNEFFVVGKSDNSEISITLDDMFNIKPLTSKIFSNQYDRFFKEGIGFNDCGVYVYGWIKSNGEKLSIIQDDDKKIEAEKLLALRQEIAKETGGVIIGNENQ